MAKQKQVILSGAVLVGIWAEIDEGVPVRTFQENYPLDFANAGEGKSRKSVDELALDAVRALIADREKIQATVNSNGTSSSSEKTARKSTTKKKRGRPVGSKNKVIDVK